MDMTHPIRRPLSLNGEQRDALHRRGQWLWNINEPGSFEMARRWRREMRCLVDVFDALGWDDHDEHDKHETVRLDADLDCLRDLLLRHRADTLHSLKYEREGLERAVARHPGYEVADVSVHAESIRRIIDEDLDHLSECDLVLGALDASATA